MKNYFYSWKILHEILFCSFFFTWSGGGITASSPLAGQLLLKERSKDRLFIIAFYLRIASSEIDFIITVWCHENKSTVLDIAEAGCRPMRWLPNPSPEAAPPGKLRPSRWKNCCWWMRRVKFSRSASCRPIPDSWNRAYWLPTASKTPEQTSYGRIFREIAINKNPCITQRTQQGKFRPDWTMK